MVDFAVPDLRAEMSAEELEWIVFLRIISGGSVPGPTLRGVQALRIALGQASKT